MNIDKAADAGLIPPCGMGRIMREARTSMGMQTAWRYGDLAWITYGTRVRMLGTVQFVRDVIEHEARRNNQPATTGWEVADV